MENLSSPIDPLSKRIAELRKFFARGLGRKATREQAFVIQQAAIARAEWERSITDPAYTPNDRARAFGVARRAKLDMEAALAPAKQRKAPVTYPSVDELVAGHIARQAQR